MSGRMTWFRMHVDFLTDPKIITLAFEDQRHFIGVLALKCDQTLDQVHDPELLDRVVAQRLWIDHSVIREVKRRLIAAGLIHENWQPVAWDRRQFKSDQDKTAAERQRRHRQKVAAVTPDVTDVSRVTSRIARNGAVTQPETETDTELCSTQPRGKFQPDGVPNQLWSDFVAVRKAKRAPITAAAMQRLEREATKANLSLPAAIQMCAERGWSSIDSSWDAVRQVAPRKSEFQSAY